MQESPHQTFTWWIGVNIATFIKQLELKFNKVISIFELPKIATQYGQR